ncbi:hypothetical protein BB561_004682 [Smittium simulii]|uniref:Uncharacterized protein n=1 Tax=Smittium simulii TaxID=133385 RepID=A0A2T9YEX8_9FUNG|nr:hypothetical protein BB561_004682 [Smittium simulii]
MNNTDEIIKIATNFAKARKYHAIDTMMSLSCIMLQQRLSLFVDLAKPQHGNNFNADLAQSQVEFLDYEGVLPQSTYASNEESIDYAFKWQQDDSGKFINTRWDLQNSYKAALDNQIMFKKNEDDSLLALVSLSTRAQLKRDKNIYAIILVHENGAWCVYNTICLEEWEKKKLEWYSSIEKANKESRAAGESNKKSNSMVQLGSVPKVEHKYTLSQSAQVEQSDSSDAEYWNQFDNMSDSGHSSPAHSISEKTERPTLKPKSSTDRNSDLLDKESYDIINNVTDSFEPSVVDYVKSLPIFNRVSSKSPFLLSQKDTTHSQSDSKSVKDDDIYHLTQSLSSLSYFAKGAGISKDDFLRLAQKAYKG